MLGLTIELMANGLSLVNSLIDSAKHGIDRSERAKIEKILEALEKLFFFEDRTRDLIVKLSNGETVEPEALERALEGFERSKDPVAEALALVDTVASQRPSFLSLDALDKLRTLRRHKGDVRYYIEAILRDLADTTDESVSPDQRRAEANQILHRIDEINSRLRDIDQYLRSR